MPDSVFANSRSIVSASSLGRSIAAFPDACASPPPPPHGPIMAPYANTAFARDLREGSESVFIEGQPICLRDRSRLARSTGDEAATSSFGGNPGSGRICGELRFVSWSMDVVVEGLSVCRHLDMATHNAGGTLPWRHMASFEPELRR